jgi:hypothetical protein
LPAFPPLPGAAQAYAVLPQYIARVRAASLARLRSDLAAANVSLPTLRPAVAAAVAAAAKLPPAGHSAPLSGPLPAPLSAPLPAALAASGPLASVAGARWCEPAHGGAGGCGGARSHHTPIARFFMHAATPDAPLCGMLGNGGASGTAAGASASGGHSCPIVSRLPYVVRLPCASDELTRALPSLAAPAQRPPGASDACSGSGHAASAAAAAPNTGRPWPATGPLSQLARCEASAGAGAGHWAAAGGALGRNGPADFCSGGGAPLLALLPNGEAMEEASKGGCEAGLVEWFCAAVGLDAGASTDGGGELPLSPPDITRLPSACSDATLVPLQHAGRSVSSQAIALAAAAGCIHRGSGCGSADAGATPSASWGSGEGAGGPVSEERRTHPGCSLAATSSNVAEVSLFQTWAAEGLNSDGLF